jgi:hypothetical protein
MKPDAVLNLSSPLLLSRTPVKSYFSNNRLEFLSPSHYMYGHCPLNQDDIDYTDDDDDDSDDNNNTVTCQVLVALL